jgi:predicted TIM-barrel fold metal-dependent hydrolase
MPDKLREAIYSLLIVDQHSHPGIAGFFENFPPEKRLIIAVDPYRTPEESSNGFSYLREAHYEAYEKIYGFSRGDIDDPNKKDDLVREYDRQRNNLRYLIDKAMEAAGVEMLIVNSFLHEDLKNKPKIKFIPLVDPLLFPFDNTYLTMRGTMTSSFLAVFDHMLKILKAKTRCSLYDFAGYLEFVDKVLDNFVKNGAVGFKFFTAYVRNTNFEKVEEKEGPMLFESARTGESSAYTKLQDLLVWHIMRKSVHYKLPVQWHFALLDSYIEHFDCLNLTKMIQDPVLSNAKIVILHGGYPRFDHAELLALAGGFIPNNVYLDFSGSITFMNHPRILAATLRKWLEKPVLWNKIMYGSGAIWGERYIYVASKVGRDAVYFALKSMLNDDIINENTAIGLAAKLLRNNAERLYNINVKNTSSSFDS